MGRHPPPWWCLVLCVRSSEHGPGVLLLQVLSSGGRGGVWWPCGAAAGGPSCRCWPLHASLGAYIQLLARSLEGGAGLFPFLALTPWWLRSPTWQMLVHLPLSSLSQNTPALAITESHDDRSLDSTLDCTFRGAPLKSSGLANAHGGDALLRGE
eukprot:SM000212S06903  [mRNA]  locus=s212:84966:85824:+ [translate_table: standard]